MEMDTRKVVAFSGGKDSTATLLWAMKNLNGDYEALFSDTGWEHPWTYKYIWDLLQDRPEIFGRGLTIVHSDKYSGFEDMCVQRKMIPGKQIRFCTQQLKIYPMHAWIEQQDEEITCIQGVRADESLTRSRYKDEEFVNDAGGYFIYRPIFRWTAEEVFEWHAAYEIEPNPLYLVGASRVGCYPCIYTNLREIKALLKQFPGLRQRLIDLEDTVNAVCAEGAAPRQFFRGDAIPQRYCSVQVDNRKVPTAADVCDYVMATDKDQLPLLDMGGCVSVYNLCE